MPNFKCVALTSSSINYEQQTKKQKKQFFKKIYKIVFVHDIDSFNKLYT